MMSVYCGMRFRWWIMWWPAYKHKHWLQGFPKVNIRGRLFIPLLTFVNIFSRTIMAHLFEAVLPRIFGLFEYSNNWARIIVFVFIFAEFSNSEYYSNIRIIDLNTTNNVFFLNKIPYLWQLLRICKLKINNFLIMF